MEACWECWGWFSSRPPGSVPSRLDNLVTLFQQVGHRDESSLRFSMVTVETGSGDRQPHKSAYSLLNPIASSSECHCTGFLCLCSCYMSIVHVCQCIKLKSRFAMATSTKLNRCSAKQTLWCIGNHLTSCSRQRFCT